MKKIFASLAAALICVSALSVPAWRGIIKATQPDGSVVYLQKHGDEFLHWVTDSSGQIVEKDADGYWRPAKDGSSSISKRRQAAKAKRNARSISRKAGGHIALGQKRFLVILAEFSDVKFSSATAQQDFYDMMNLQGYSENGSTGSTRDYFYDNSHGVFEPIFEVYGPVTLSKTMSYYGGNDSSGNDKYPEQAIMEACKGLNDEIDFTKFDNDGDGEVDLVFMYYAGYGEADSDEENSIWPHQWSLSDAGKSLSLDGKSINSYACTNEIVGYGTFAGSMCGIGTACHEFSHAMGVPDFYDTDYDTNGQAAGMFFFSTMDSGAYNNEGHTPPYLTIEERILMGWINEKDAIKEFSKSGPISLTTVDDNIAYKTLTDQDGEYFLYECRGSNGWDSALLSNGLVVTHIDKSSRSVKLSSGSATAYSLWNNWEASNSINENGSHPCCYVIPSAKQSDLMFGYEYYPGYGYYFVDDNAPKIPFPGSSKITSYAAKSWNGVVSEITLSNIAYSNDVVSFNVSVPSEELSYPVIANPGNGRYAVGDLFEFSLIMPEAMNAASVAWFFDDEPVSEANIRLRAGSHTVEAAVTLTSGESMTVTLEISTQ